MIKGSNRKMFRKSQRKPGAAKRALGILASSQELMNTVEPVRMQAGGLVDRPPRQTGINVDFGFLDQITQADPGFVGYTPEGNVRFRPVPTFAKTIEVRPEQYYNQRLSQQSNREQLGLGLEMPMFSDRAEVLKDASQGLPYDATGINQLSPEVRAELADRMRGMTQTQSRTMGEGDRSVLDQLQQASEARRSMGFDATYMDEKPGPGLGEKGRQAVQRGEEAASSLLNDLVTKGYIGNLVESTKPAVAAFMENPKTFGLTSQSLRDMGDRLFSSDKQEQDTKPTPEELAEKAAKEMTLQGDAGKEAQNAALKEEKDKGASVMESALAKLSGSKAEKSGDINDLLIRVGLSIAAGDDPRAMKNIAEGTLKGIKSYEASEAVRQQLQPKLIQTLKAFEDAGLTDEEKKYLLPLAFNTTRDRSSSDERLLDEMEQLIEAGDVERAAAVAAALYKTDLETAREDIEDRIKREAAKTAAAKTAAADSRAAKKDETNFFSDITNRFFGDDD